MAYSQIFNVVFEVVRLEAYLEMSASLLLSGLRILWRDYEVIHNLFRSGGLDLTRVIDNLFDAFLPSEVCHTIQLSSLPLGVILAFQTLWTDDDSLAFLKSGRTEDSQL